MTLAFVTLRLPKMGSSFSATTEHSFPTLPYKLITITRIAVFSRVQKEPNGWWNYKCSRSLATFKPHTTIREFLHSTYSSKKIKLSNSIYRKLFRSIKFISLFLGRERTRESAARGKSANFLNGTEKQYKIFFSLFLSSVSVS